MDSSVLIIILVYIVMLAVIGVYFNKRNRNNKDFYVTRDRIPGWAIAISERATTSSSWMMLGGTGAVYGLSLIHIYWQKEKGQFLNMVRSCLTALNIIEPESKIRMETEI